MASNIVELMLGLTLLGGLFGLEGTSIVCLSSELSAEAPLLVGSGVFTPVGDVGFAVEESGVQARA